MMTVDTDNRTNGRVLRLGQTRPERIPIYLGEDPDPIMAWVVANGRYPVSVAAELDDARAEYRKHWIRVLDGPAQPLLVDAVHSLLEETTGGTRLPSKDKLKELLEGLASALAQHEAEPVWEQRETDYQAYVAHVIMILAPGVEEQVVDMLSNDDRLAILAATGYLGPEASDAVDAAAEPVVETSEASAEQAPPVPEASSTGDEPEPASATFTAG